MAEQGKISKADEYQFIADAMLREPPFGITFFDTNYRIVEVNKMQAKYDGRKRRGYLGRLPEEIWGEKGRKIKEYLRGVVREGRAKKMIEMTVKKQGRNEEMVWRVGFYPVQGKEAKVVMVGMQTEDISERKVIEAELARSKDELQWWIETMPDALVKVDKQGVILQANEAARQLGQAEGNKLYAGVRVLNPDGVRYPSANLAYRRVFSSGRTVRRVRVILEDEDGERIAVEEAAAPICDKKGAAVEAVVVIRDVTKQLDEDRRHERFIGIIGHELKNPLAAMKIMVQILEQRLGKLGRADLSELAVKIDRNIDTLTGLINGLVDVTKVGTGKITFNKSRFELREAAEEAAEESRMVQQSHRILIRGVKKAEVEGDRQRIKQVIVNLLSNAVKFSPGKKKIVIDISKKSDEVILAVKDWGVGIAKGDKGRIFDIYYQAERTARYQAAGAGIGLYIAKEVVKKHKGKIRVESSPGKGSIFYISLPVAG